MKHCEEIPPDYVIAESDSGFVALADQWRSTVREKRHLAVLDAWAHRAGIFPLPDLPPPWRIRDFTSQHIVLANSHTQLKIGYARYSSRVACLYAGEGTEIEALEYGCWLARSLYMDAPNPLLVIQSIDKPMLEIAPQQDAQDGND